MLWEAFCEAKPPYGFGMAAEELEVIIQAKPLAQVMAADPECKAFAEPNKTNRHNRSVDNINARPTGTSTSYLVRRLKRDHPAIAAALARGDYRSARAAALAAGIIKSREQFGL